MKTDGFTQEELTAMIEQARLKPVGKCTCPRQPATGFRIAIDNECAEHQRASHAGDSYD